jgi:multicomponent Na+:H+ antiporter subunit A
MMRRSLILDVVVRLVFHSSLLLGLFLLFTGHNRPGGGFVGGLVIGAGLSLHYVAGGIDEVRATLPVRPWTLLGTGLATATATCLVPLLFGRQLMEHAKLDADMGPLGALHLNTALFFDMGVAQVVVGMVLLLLVAFGERLPLFGAPWALRADAEADR